MSRSHRFGFATSAVKPPPSDARPRLIATKDSREFDAVIARIKAGEFKWYRLDRGDGNAGWEFHVYYPS